VYLSEYGEKYERLRRKEERGIERGREGGREGRREGGRKLTQQRVPVCLYQKRFKTK
jgi:hypothetical protein